MRVHCLHCTRPDRYGAFYICPVEHEVLRKQIVDLLNLKAFRVATLRSSACNHHPYDASTTLPRQVNNNLGVSISWKKNGGPERSWKAWSHEYFKTVKCAVGFNINSAASQVVIGTPSGWVVPRGWPLMATRTCLDKGQEANVQAVLLCMLALKSQLESINLSIVSLNDLSISIDRYCIL